MVDRRWLGRTALVLVLASGAQVAAADDDFGVAVGLKFWSNRWTTNVPSIVPGLPPLINLQFTTGTEVALIPTLSLRWRQWFLSGGCLGKTDYEVSGFGLQREECDVNLGYRVLPGMVVSMGYKRLSFLSGATLSLGNTIGLASYKVDGPVLGLSLGTTVEEGLGFVGGLGTGRLKTQYEGTGSYGTQYVLAELGLNYRLPKTWGGLDSLSIGAGYRHQTLSVKASVFAFGQRYRDVTQGPTLSITGTF